MNTRSVVLVLCVAALVGIAVIAAFDNRAPDRQARRPNVVFILLDALRADRFGAHRDGVPITPRLAELAADGRYFSRAVTQCTWTKPAMASIFSSRYVDAHQVYFSTEPGGGDAALSDRLPADLPTLAPFLKRAGYHSAAIQTNGNLLSEFGFANGFDAYQFQSDAPADWVTDRAIAQASQLEEPFFLYAHYMDPHAPYVPPPDYRTLFGPMPDLTSDDEWILNHFMDYFYDFATHFVGAKEERQYPDLSPGGREEVIRRYDAAVRFMDDKVAALIDHIRESAPETLFVVVADHGEEFWDHRSIGHGSTVYQEQVLVPLVFWGPGVEPRRVDSPVETLNIAPTIAKYVGLEPHANWQGEINLLVDGPLPPEKPLFSHTRGAWRSLNIDAETVIQGNDKLIRHRFTGACELYDLLEDPAELVNIASNQPDRVDRLARLLDAHRERNLDHLATGPAPEQTEISPDIEEQLKALGYMPDG